MKASWLCVVLLATACTDSSQLKDSVSYHFGHKEIKYEVTHCAKQSGLRHIEMKLGPYPHYLVHCTEGVAAHREIVCESCKDGRPEDSYFLSASSLNKAEQGCKTKGHLVWIEFKKSKDPLNWIKRKFHTEGYFMAVCSYGVFPL